MTKSANTWSKPPKTAWVSTVAFRRFREKHGNLSRIYWTWQLGIDATLKAASSGVSTDFVTDVVRPKFTRAMLPDTCEEFRNREVNRTGIFRLYLLVICAANLEAYLQDAIRLFVGSNGHAVGPRKLNPVGEAIARPVVQSSTIPDMLDYIESLLNISFGDHRLRWQTAFKLRCTAAHNGGIADTKAKKKMPDLRTQVGEPITITWDQLITFLSSADEIVAFVDFAISTPSLRSLECEWELHAIKEQGQLPARKDLWDFAFRSFGGRVEKKQKERIERELYAK
jgi:hypothetical protein